jgi:hypothetical protein
MIAAGMRTRGKSHGRGRAREIPALLFALVWLLGYEALPLAHVAMHAQLAPHDHGAAAAADGLAEPAHCHGDVCHHEEADGGGTASASAGDPIAHGQNSLEHRGLAALAPDLTIYVAVLTPIAELASDVAPEARPEAFAAVSPPARGPPA